MSRSVIPAAAVAAAAAILTAGCASAGASGLGAVDDGAASIVPANAVSFVAASTDLTSSEWHGLAKPFLQDVQEYQSALGNEVDVAELPGKQVVVLTQPADAQKLDALAVKKGEQTRKIGDWTAIAKTSAVLDTVASAATHLAGSSAFTDAMAALPDKALVRAYANSDNAQQLLFAIPGVMQSTSAPGGIPFRQRKTKQLGGQNIAMTEIKWLAAAVTNESGGLRAQAFVKTGGLVAAAPPRFIMRPMTPYRSSLVDEIPSGALLVVDFQAPPAMFELSGVPEPLQQLLGSKLSTILATELDQIFGGETAIFVTPGAPIPDITVVTQPPTDTLSAGQALGQILNAVPDSSPLHTMKLVETTIGGQFVISTSQAGIDAFRGGGAKLSSDSTFLGAAKQAGMGEDSTGFVYANVKDALPLLELAGVKLPSGLPSLKTFFAYGDASANESTFTAFLGVG
jgi:hypothetical protein